MRNKDIQSNMKETIRKNKKISKKEMKKQRRSIKKDMSSRRRTPVFRAFVIAVKVMVIAALVGVAAFTFWIYNQIDFEFGDNLGTFSLKLSSTIYCKNSDGDYVEYEHFKSPDNRIWVSIDKIPKNLQDAFVAIEDQRFYEHRGVDLKRTLGAVLNVFVKGDSSYGGSTITQQLIKNITHDNERTNMRKIREMTRSVVLETKMSKKQILELYMNSIYLSQGVHGVESAANVYFGKSVDKLTLAECASIAGITQYPTTYDPLINPKNNKKKQLTVLGKMLELGFITEDEYNKAINEELVFTGGSTQKTESADTSYFADYIFEQAKSDLMKEFDYTDQFAEDVLLNGGLKIYATIDLNVQNIMDNYYQNDSNFSVVSGGERVQSAMIIIEPSTGEIKGLTGGRGIKEGARVLNRATQSKRQPGSSIKPIGVYAPALDSNVINLSSYVANSKITIGGWTPKNANNKFTGPVSVKSAVAYSYNIPAINILKKLGIDKSFEYMHDKMHMTSLIDETERGGKKYSDKTLASLALGGLTDGVTPLEMAGAYATIANGGMYIEPSSYTKICDKNDNLFYERKPVKTRVFSEESAFLTQQLLQGVVKYGTAAGNAISGIETCGKTGTTDDNKDKWFMGFTPYYCGAVWYGFDKPRVINTGVNPSVGIWKTIMTEVHKGLENKKFDQPDGIIKARVCPYTGLYESGSAASEYANKKFLTGYCGGKGHVIIGGGQAGSYSTSQSSKTTTTKKSDENSSKTDSDKNNTKSESSKSENTQSGTSHSSGSGQSGSQSGSNQGGSQNSGTISGGSGQTGQAQQGESQPAASGDIGAE